MTINAFNKKLREENEALRSLLISGKGGSPYEPYDDPEKGKGPFVPAPGKGKDKLDLAHSPSGTYGPYGEELKIAPWKGIDRGGNPIDIEHLKEGYQEEQKEREQLHEWKFHGGKKPKQADAANTIKKTWPWRTRIKEGTKYPAYREMYDPLTGLPLLKA